MGNNRRRFADWKEHERELTPTQLELAERIRTAFAGITCGESLGYMSGEAADGPCTEEYLRVFMQREVRRDWTAITPDGLYCCKCCLTYVDPVGFRFLLPAYMPADMQYPSGAWLGLDTRLLLAPEEQFSLFTPARRECVSDYVNEQRLAELREYNEFNLWDKLLPWEKAALPPGADKHHAAAEIARAYAAKHGITLSFCS